MMVASASLKSCGREKTTCANLEDKRVASCSEAGATPEKQPSNTACVQLLQRTMQAIDMVDCPQVAPSPNHALESRCARLGAWRSHILKHNYAGRYWLTTCSPIVVVCSQGRDGVRCKIAIS